MLPNCMGCKKNGMSKNPKVIKAEKKRLVLLSKYVVCDIKKSRFIKEQDASFSDNTGEAFCITGKLLGRNFVDKP